MKNPDFSKLLNSNNIKIFRIAVIAVIIIGIALFALVGTGRSQDTESAVVAVGFTDFSEILYPGIDLSTLEAKVSEYTGYDCTAEITSTGISKVYSLVMTFPVNAEFDREALGDFINSNFSDISITALSVYQKQPAILKASFLGLLVTVLIVSGIMMLVQNIGRSDKSNAVPSLISSLASFGFVFGLMNIVRIGGIERIYAASIAALMVSWYLLYSYTNASVKSKTRKKQSSNRSDFDEKQLSTSFYVIVVASALCCAGAVISSVMSKPQVALTMAATLIAIAGACSVTPVMYINRQ